VIRTHAIWIMSLLKLMFGLSVTFCLLNVAREA